MKLTRIAILLILAAAGCRFAVTQKDVAARRLTEMVLSRLVSLQSGPATVASAASSPSAAPRVVSAQRTVPAVARQWSASTVTTNTLCPQATNALRNRVAVQRAASSGGQSGIVWIRLVLPDAVPCERAKLSGS